MTYSGSVSPSASATVNIANTADGNPLALAIGGEDGGNANFDALVGEKFYKAILASVDAATVKFYRDQGWPDEFLFSLMIERIEYSESVGEKYLHLEGAGYLTGDGKNHLKQTGVERGVNFDVIDNDPDMPEQYLLFRAVVSTIADSSLYTVRMHADSSSPAPYCTENGPLSRGFDPTVCGKLKGYREAFKLGDAKGADLSFIDEKARKDFVIHNSVVFRKVGADAQCVLFIKREETPSDSRNGSASITDPTTPENAPPPFEACTDGDGTEDKPYLRIVFRSPNSIVYYLGELLRAQDNLGENYRSLCRRYFDITQARAFEAGDFVFGAKNPCASTGLLLSQRESIDGLADSKNDNSNAALFYLEKSSATRRLHGEGRYRFKFNELQYAVSANPALKGRTMQAVTLVNELFFQKQEASDAPAVTILEGSTF